MAHDSGTRRRSGFLVRVPQSESSLSLTRQDVDGKTERFPMGIFPHRASSPTSVETRRVDSESDEAPPAWAPYQSTPRVIVNVCGRKFDVPRELLRRFPDTLLGSSKIEEFYVPDRDEYYFNRNRQCFEQILMFYQNGGLLRRQKDVALDEFITEALFFQLGTAAIVELCNHEGFRSRSSVQLPKNKVFRELWKLMEIPESSRAAKWTAIFSMFMIVVSIVAFCLGTVPGLSQTNSPFKKNVTYVHEQSAKSEQKSKAEAPPVDSVPENVTQPKVSTDPDEIKLLRGYSQFREPLFILESICVVWFTFELAVRLVSCPSKKQFFKSFLNWIDFLSIVPFYVDLAITLANIAAGRTGVGSTGLLAALRSLRLVRIFRVFKLTRHFAGLQTLALTFRASFKELGLLLLFLWLGVLLFSTAAYYAEQGQTRDQFSSIPDSFWWAIVTMTTVGYGDTTPTSILGKLVGAMCAVSGVIAVALPVPVIVNNFSIIHERQKDRPRIEQLLDTASASRNVSKRSSVRENV